MRERTDKVRTHTRRVLNRRKPAVAVSDATEVTAGDAAEAVPVAVGTKPAPGARPVRPSGSRTGRPAGKRSPRER
jgi:preprotein translocase subunit SecF